MTVSEIWQAVQGLTSELKCRITLFLIAVSPGLILRSLYANVNVLGGTISVSWKI
jgi:hypothetical protein